MASSFFLGFSEHMFTSYSFSTMASPDPPYIMQEGVLWDGVLGPVLYAHGSRSEEVVCGIPWDKFLVFLACERPSLPPDNPHL